MTGHALAGAALAAVLALAGGAPAAGRGVAAWDLANRCFALRSASTNKYVAAAGDGYRADGARAAAALFFLKPSGLGTYLPFDQGGLLMIARGSVGVGRDSAPG